jgi:hypothetical protein
MKRLLFLALLLTSTCYGQVSFSNVSFSGVSTVSTVVAPPSALPTGFNGWQRIGNPSYTWATTFGGSAGASNCAASFTSSCAYMNTTILFSQPDSVTNNVSGSFTNSPNQGLPNGWNPSAPTVPLAPGTNGYYVFQQDVKNVMNAQSEGILDPYRNQYYIFGGGHTDSYDNSIFAIDLTTSPFNIKRVKGRFVARQHHQLTQQYSECQYQCDGRGRTGCGSGGGYSECAANTTTGIGCAPGSRHTTQAMQVVYRTDVEREARGSSTTRKTSLSRWRFIETQREHGQRCLDSSTRNSGHERIEWVANYQMTGTTGYHTWPGVGEPTLFGTTSAVDPRNGVVFVTDPNYIFGGISMGIR